MSMTGPQGFRRVVVALLLLASGCRSAERYDLVIRGGTIYDGTGGKPFVGEVAIVGDSIAAVGRLVEGHGRREIQAGGLAVAPGFVNMLSWATASLIEDGRSQGDIRQGVTLEVFGEGWSMGPLTDTMKAVMLSQQSDIKYPITWTTLGEYLDTSHCAGREPQHRLLCWGHDRTHP